MKHSDEKLLEIARALADSQKVDWDAAESDAQDNDERELVGLLREIGELADLYRTRSKDAETMAQEASGGNLAAGSVWGQLELVGLLGEGASAQVFRARDRKLDREVALKLFRPDSRMRMEQRRALLLEGRNLARLRHENVVTVLGADEHDGRIGIWMELVEGRTLSEIVYSQGPYSATEATQIGIELCRALAAVHRKGLVHADLKAQNVKREEGGRIVLMDFSSSRGSEQSPGNPESDPTGTPLYMAPELWERGSPTVESDIYALGVLLYHLVTGEFPVRAASVEELRRAHARGERTLLRDERPGLPEGFVRTVEKALRRDPGDRFRSAGAFEETLRDELRAAPGGGVAVSPASPPLPLEVRVIARLARVGMWVGGIVAVLVALGFITSTALNVTLGRPSEYAPESIFDWLVWGARSLIGPTYHAVVTLGPFVVLWALVRLARRYEPVRRRLDAWTDGLGALASRLGLADPRTLLQTAAALGALAVAALLWRHYELIDAIYGAVGTRIDPASMALLDPGNFKAHLAYRRDFTLLVIALVVALLVIRAYGKSTGQPLPTPAALGLGFVIACGAVLMEFPWQILWQARFPRVEYASERCYEVGAREDELFLFCPRSRESKSRVVSRNDEDLVRTGVIESVFTTPGDPPTSLEETFDSDRLSFVAYFERSTNHAIQVLRARDCSDSRNGNTVR